MESRRVLGTKTCCGDQIVKVAVASCVGAVSEFSLGMYGGCLIWFGFCVGN